MLKIFEKIEYSNGVVLTKKIADTLSQNYTYEIRIRRNLVLIEYWIDNDAEMPYAFYEYGSRVYINGEVRFLQRDEHCDIEEAQAGFAEQIKEPAKPWCIGRDYYWTCYKGIDQWMERHKAIADLAADAIRKTLN